MDATAFIPSSRKKWLLKNSISSWGGSFFPDGTSAFYSPSLVQPVPGNGAGIAGAFPALAGRELIMR